MAQPIVVNKAVSFLRVDSRHEARHRHGRLVHVHHLGLGDELRSLDEPDTVVQFLERLYLTRLFFELAFDRASACPRGLGHPHCPGFV